MEKQNKENQKKLLTEIMEADQKNGLYDIPGVEEKMTAVEWLIERIESTSHDLHHLMKVRGEFEKAKQREKEQIIAAWKKNPEGYNHSGERYYNETYGKDSNESNA